jgi:TPR repeat protein
VIKHIVSVLTVIMVGLPLFAGTGSAASKQETREAKTMYSKGNFQYGEKDYRKAMMWYSRASKNDYAPANYKLGMIYSRGLGIPINSRTAAKWYTKSAKQGYHPAQYELGKMYERGRGVSRDVLEAYMWYQLAIDSGSKIAKKYLTNLISTMDKRQIVAAQKLVQEHREQK